MGGALLGLVVLLSIIDECILLLACLFAYLLVRQTGLIEQEAIRKKKYQLRTFC